MGKSAIGRLFGSIFGDSNKSEADEDEVRGPKYNGSDRDVHADEVLEARDAKFGKLYVISLVDFYDIIGSRTGRLAEALLLICERVLEDRVGGRGCYGFTHGEEYFFRFEELSEDEGWVEANKIVDEIGFRILGNSYKSNKVRLAIVEHGEIVRDSTDPDSEIDDEKVQEALKAATGKPRERVLKDWQYFKRSAKSEAKVGWEKLNVEKKKKTVEWKPMVREDEADAADQGGARTFRPEIWKPRHGERRQKTLAVEDDRRSGGDRRTIASGVVRSPHR